MQSLAEFSDRLFVVLIGTRQDKINPLQLHIPEPMGSQMGIDGSADHSGTIFRYHPFPAPGRHLQRKDGYARWWFLMQEWVHPIRNYADRVRDDLFIDLAKIHILRS